MPYALMQHTLEPPPVEQLKAAFRALPSLTDLDAATMAQDAFGVLVQGLELADAGRLLQALNAQGIEAEMVDEASLPPLPPPRPCRRADPRPDAFVPCDHLGRPHELEWSKVILLAAGAVPMREMKHTTKQRVVGYSAGAPYGYHALADDSPYGGAITRTVHSDKEVESVKLLLDVLLAEAPGRYRIDAEKFHFGYLGERRAPNRTKNYLQLVGACLQNATGAVLNRGAEELLNDPTAVLQYRSEHAFEEETVWLLWRHFGSGKEA
jgi:hypothetical protein